MGRMVVVGGEVSRRGLWGGNRTGPEWIGLSVARRWGWCCHFPLKDVIVLGLIVGAAIVGLGVVLTTPSKITGYRSLGALYRGAAATSVPAGRTRPRRLFR